MVTGGKPLVSLRGKKDHHRRSLQEFVVRQEPQATAGDKMGLRGAKFKERSARTC